MTKTSPSVTVQSRTRIEGFTSHNRDFLYPMKLIFLIVDEPISPAETEEIVMAENLDLDTIETTVNPVALKNMLNESGYNRHATQQLFAGFSEGFDIGYRGPLIRRNTAHNLPFRVGSNIVLWNKIMKEVAVKHIAGPFRQIPFDNYMQSPVGLVPKARDQMRMIFHLSYDFNETYRSLNFFTPDDLCSVHYNDLDTVMTQCLAMLQQLNFLPGDPNATIWFSKTDLKSAFRLLPVQRDQWPWLVFKAKHPKDRQDRFFVDKCVPFGASRSCALFQSFSDSLKHLVEFYTGHCYTVVNYLDDFLFISLDRHASNYMVSIFTKISFAVGFTIAKEKMEPASPRMIFLRILLDGKTSHLVVPEEKN